MVVKFQYYGEFDVYEVSPAGGHKAGGTEVTVTGVGMFMTGTYLNCFFGDGKYECGNGFSYPSYKAVPAVFRTPTSVSCVSPSMPEGGTVTGFYPIRVGLNAQYSQACPNAQTDYQCALKAALTFKYYKDVYVTGISPNSGQVKGGTELTVYGSGFRTDLGSQTRCVFTRCTEADIFMSGDRYGKFRSPSQTKCTGQTTLAPFAPGEVGVVSDTVIKCLSPMASTVDSHFTLFDISLNKGVTTQNLYGPLCQNGCPVMFYFYSLPQISSNSPILGPVVGNTVVTMSGLGFIGTQNTAIRCKFGMVESTTERTGAVNPVKYLTGSTISCVAPAQSVGTVRVSVSLNGLDSDFTRVELGALYRYHGPPKLSGRPTPSVGPTTGGTFITISGTSFLRGQLQCKFWTGASKGNLNKVVVADFLSSTSASCVSPPVIQSQLVSLSLSLNGQDFSPFFLEDLFYYFPAPEIYKLHPPGGPAQSGGYAMVQGKGFLNTVAIKCRVCVVVSAARYFNDSFVGCAIPQIQRKLYSQVVANNLGIMPEVLSDSFAVYPVQAYPVETSFDGQTFSTSGIKYVYHTTPQVDQIVPNSGAKSKLTMVAIIHGDNFRNDFVGPFCRFAGIGTTKTVFMSDRIIRCLIPTVLLGKTVLLEISVNGQEYEDHSSSTFSFMAVAPVLRLASLSRSFDLISLDFDVNTDRGSNQVGTFPCGNILKWRWEDISSQSSGLSTAQVEALGSDPTDAAVFTLLYGHGVQCQFETNQTASIVLGAFPNFMLGHPIWLKEKMFRRGIELSQYASGSITLSSTYATPKPVALFASPSQIGGCDAFNIDAAPSSGGLGRSLYFSWILDRKNSNITDLNIEPMDKVMYLDKFADAIASFSGQAFDVEDKFCQNSKCLVSTVNNLEPRYTNCFCNAIRIPFASYPCGMYTVELTVSNWQNSESSPASISITKQLKAIPIVTIDMYSSNNNLMLSVNYSMSLSGTGVGSTCNSAPPTLLFKWTILDAQMVPLLLDASVQVNVKSISLPPFALLAGRTYFANLSVTDKNTVCILPERCTLPTYTPSQCCAVGSDLVSFQTGHSFPLAKILGSERIAAAQTELQLDGSQSFHPDYPGAKQPTLQYKWTCKDTPASNFSTSSKGGCFCIGGIEFGSRTGKIMVIPKDSMCVSTMLNGQYVPVVYEFSLNVSDTISWNVATVRVHPRSESVPLVSVMINDVNRVYPPNLRISLMSVVEPAASPMDSLTYEWKTVTGDVDLTKNQYLLSPNSRSKGLVIKPHVLTPGQQYTVRLSVIENRKAGFDHITFMMDNPPSGGIFELSPTTGISLDTRFKLSAMNWQVDQDMFPITYTFEYLQQGSNKFRLVQGASESSFINAMLPPGFSGELNEWALQLRISNLIGSENLAKTCNLIPGDCMVKVVPKAYASTEAMMTDFTACSLIIEQLIQAGDPNGAINYAILLLSAMNSEQVGTRRMSLLAVNNTAMAAYKCGTALPSVFQALPNGGLIGRPDADSLARASIQAVVSAFLVNTQVNDQCLLEMDKIYSTVLQYTSKASGLAWEQEPDLILLQDLSDAISLAIDAVELQYTSAAISKIIAVTRMATLITRHENITATRAYGSIPSGETAKSLDSARTRSKSWRISTPTAFASARGWHRTPGLMVDDALSEALQLSHVDDSPEEPLVYPEGRWLMPTTNPGTTSLSALTGSFMQSIFSMPANVLPFRINKVGCSTASNSAQICESASVSAVATQYANFFNPHFYSEDAQFVIAPVLSLQLQAFGIQEVVPVEKLKNEIAFDLVLTRVPDSTKDVVGRHRVAACVYWNGIKWDTSGCMLQPEGFVLADHGRNDMRAICFCNHTSAHTVLDAPAGCDGVPYSVKHYDGCKVCGGDSSTCIGCDGNIASGKVLDGCGKCGGDDSTCAGCDGVARSGLVIDHCNVCGGDNSTCRGCDGISIHPYVTARFPAKTPKVHDDCTSVKFPLGVCGGCDASCKGCDATQNSGKGYDKCGRCGEYLNAAEAASGDIGDLDWYARTSRDNCTLGLKKCAAGFVPDSCGTCVQFGTPGDNTRNQAYKGCDAKASVFSYQYGKRQQGGLTTDQCGVCGGNDCSCIDAGY